MAGLYLSIRNDIRALWDASWTQDSATVPVYWRDNDAEPTPDPAWVQHFVRCQVSFGREEIRAFGGGLGNNEKVQFGRVEFMVFAARSAQSEDTALELLDEAMATMRSKRVTGSYASGASDLSFIGAGSGFESGPEEDGNWFYRGSLLVWEYRFRG